MTRLLLCVTGALAAFHTASAEHVDTLAKCVETFQLRLTAVQQLKQPMPEASDRLQRWLVSRNTDGFCHELCSSVYHPKVESKFFGLGRKAEDAYYDVPDSDADKDAAILRALRNDATYLDMENADACVAFAQRKAGSGWPAALSAYKRTEECLGFAEDVSIDSASFKQHVLDQIQQHTTGGAKPLADTMKDVEQQVVSHFESACADAVDSELLRNYENDFFRSVLENSEVQKACRADMHLTPAATVNVSGVVAKLESQYNLLARLKYLHVFSGDAVAKELVAGKDNMVRFMSSWNKEVNAEDCLLQTQKTEQYAALQKSMLEDCERRVRDHPVFSVMRKAKKDKQVTEMCTTGEHAYDANGIIHALSQSYADDMKPLYARVALIKESEKADEIITGMDNEYIMTFCPIQDGEELDVDAVLESVKKDKYYTDTKEEETKFIDAVEKQVNDKAISKVLINNTYKLFRSESRAPVQVVDVSSSITQYKDARDKVLEKIAKHYRDDIRKTFVEDGGKKEEEVNVALRDVISAEITKAAENAATLNILQDADTLEQKTTASLKDSSTVQGLVKEKLSAPRKIQKLIVKKVMQSDAIKEALDKFPTDAKKAKTKTLQEAVSKAVSEKFVDGEEPVEDPLKILYPGEELDKMLKTILGEADEGGDDVVRLLKECVDTVKNNEEVKKKVNGATVEDNVYEAACTDAKKDAKYDHDDAVKKFLDTYKKPCDPLCTIIIVIACVAGGLIVLGLIYVMCYMFDDETDEVSEEYDEETEDQEEDHEGTVVSCP